ncbi:competence type IV pilus minor pilin ComGF [Bacillus massiliglaciei]|uniref:competence type IV pilus minor pilin ComGF n=1 Tax=Bacillus massiliglaciei TaxID=1816693 RepID=UPI0018FE0D56|nr:competence type IV pilus minor pilin ComGF [Bacillus massiliglaciei]
MRPNEKGFTLVEMLSSLVIFMVITMCLLQLFIIINKQTVSGDGLNEKEWEIFCTQLKHEIHLSSEQKAAGSKLVLMNAGNLITIEQYQDKIRRQVNGTGHEVFLQEIAAFHVEEEGKGLAVSVKDKGGHLYERKIYPVLTEGVPVQTAAE